jgi:hypothetical protein
MTSNHIQRRGKEGLGLCYFCWMSEESKNHPFKDCSFTQHIWHELRRQLGISSLWEGISIDGCFQDFFTTHAWKSLHLLPILVEWGLLSSFKQGKPEPNPHISSMVEINKNLA